MPFSTLSLVLLLTIALYSTLRFYTNRIAGIYAFKRILLGCVLGLASVRGGIDRNILLTIVLAFLSEFVFSALRYRYEMVPKSL